MPKRLFQQFLINALEMTLQLKSKSTETTRTSNLLPDTLTKLQLSSLHYGQNRGRIRTRRRMHRLKAVSSCIFIQLQKFQSINKLIIALFFEFSPAHMHKFECNRVPVLAMHYIFGFFIGYFYSEYIG